MFYYDKRYQEHFLGDVWSKKLILDDLFFSNVQINIFLPVQSINILSHGSVSERKLHIWKGNFIIYKMC